MPAPAARGPASTDGAPSRFSHRSRGWCEAPLNALAASPIDPHMVAAVSMDGTARVVNLATKKVVAVVDHNDGSGTRAAGGSAGELGDEAEDEDEEESTSVEAAAFCEVQPWLATGATNGCLTITDLGASATRHRLRLAGGIIKLRWLPGSALLLASTTVGVVVLLDARDGTVKAELTGHAGMVYDAWTDGLVAVTAGDDGSSRVFVLTGPSRADSRTGQ